MGQNEKLVAAVAAKEKISAEFMSRPDVVSVGVGMVDGEYVVVVAVMDKAGVADLPAERDGVEVRVEFGGRVVAASK